MPPSVMNAGVPRVLFLNQDGCFTIENGALTCQKMVRLYKHIKSRFSFSQLISATSPHYMSTHGVNWMDVTRLVLNQQSLCSQSPVDLSFLEWPEIIIGLVVCGCEGLVCVRNPVAICNSSCSSFLVPKLAIRRFNWPWNVDCKLWFEKTRDSKVIFRPYLALTCHAFIFYFVIFFLVS